MSDLEKIYYDEINPLMLEIIEICKVHDLPFHALASFKNGNYCVTHIPDDTDEVMKGLLNQWNVMVTLNKNLDNLFGEEK